MKLSINVIPKDAEEAQQILAALAPFPIEEQVTGSAPSGKSSKRKTKAEKDAEASATPPTNPPATPPTTAPAAPPATPTAYTPPAAPPNTTPAPAAPPAYTPPDAPVPPAAAASVPSSKDEFIQMLNTFITTHPYGEAYAGPLVQYHLSAFQASIASELDPAYYPAFIQAINAPPPPSA